MSERICANCENWHLEVNALPSNLRRIAKKVTKGSADPLLSQYGKCRASFIDTAGEPREYDAGSLGASECFATDNWGDKLFSPVPED